MQIPPRKRKSARQRRRRSEARDSQRHCTRPVERISVRNSEIATHLATRAVKVFYAGAKRNQLAAAAGVGWAAEGCGERGGVAH